MDNASKLIEILGLVNNYIKASDKTVESMKSYLTEAQYETLIEKRKEMNEIARPKIEKRFANAYREIFTEDELEDIINWYSSSTGNKLLKNTRNVLNNCDKAYSDAYKEALCEMYPGYDGLTSNKNSFTGLKDLRSNDLGLDSGLGAWGKDSKKVLN